ncbi:uncharacterized protein LOC130368054 [Hyla sarda]|uniref:uncharacterized protein LOC130368054 n=1 Tax=Hyla sarda TaxID=327740 RepID=UPI0024C2442D|nr:uncharacterized protein LOC130368054 [Hyla sarda]
MRKNLDMSPVMNHYSFRSFIPVKQIIYPIPPYMSIRRDGIEVFKLPVSRRRLMDMIKKFDPNDITYIDESSYTRFSKVDNTSIRDHLNKYFVINNDTVWAKHLAGENEQLKAQFKIQVHVKWNPAKPPITLQVQNQDLYLSYDPNAERQLKLLPLGQRALDFTNPDTKRFFFYITPVANRKYSFEPVMASGSLLSTSNDSTSRVTVEPASNTYYTDFAFDAAFNMGVMNRPSFVGPDIEKTSEDDTTFYSNQDKLFQDRYQSILAQEDYLMDVTSLALKSPYQWFRQHNNYQSSYLGRQYMCK